MAHEPSRVFKVYQKSKIRKAKSNENGLESCSGKGYFRGKSYISYKKAAKIRNRFSERCSYYILQEVFAKPEDFVECGKGDFLVAFKEYYVALQDAMKQVGLEEYEVGIDTKDCFQMNITYCVYYEVAKSLGNSINCYYSTCYGDEVFFPKLCEQVNFKFKRQGTLATGKPCCDMTFIRKNIEYGNINKVQKTESDYIF